MQVSQTLTSQNIRRAFLNYFKSKGHSIISSSPVIPHDDPTLLFINAGMNQFKDVFLGASPRDYTRAATSQKCVRVGGKHNDLENVGHTSRHLTFFEMLGNFSFGDYFKKEAIQMAWEVSTEVFGFDPDRIWPTVFREDDEAFELWKAYVPEGRITRFDEKDNFWAMGDTGPCGPCSELYYDKGPQFGAGNTPKEDIAGERFLEFWNLVFMQFNRSADGVMHPLPKPSIDTGAGLERVMSLKMGVDTVFETDVLRALIGRVEEISKVPYVMNDPIKAPAFRVIADHLRALAFAISDGVQPSNLDRGYVLRKILRRAVRYGRQLGLEEPFLGRVLPKLIETMGPDYPELATSQNRIAEILQTEEEAFLRTLKRGGNLLNQIMERAKAHQGQISGEDAFKLKDTYGLPFEEITLLAKDGGLAVDEVRYRSLEKEARERSKSSRKEVDQIARESLFEPFVEEHGATHFFGYDKTSATSRVIGLVKDGQFALAIEAGDEAIVLLDETPFYAEMGGQVGDTGELTAPNVSFEVVDCKAPFKGLIGHVGKLKEGQLKLGMEVQASVDAKRRQKIANNHTATHLLHFALQKVLGEHIRQAGSVVDPFRLRFDFSHHKAVSQEELQAIEDIVNVKIRENHPVNWYELSYEDVKDRSDIKQFFGEKYGTKVRVVETGQAKELCGGTHTAASGNIGYFRIEKESSIAAGVRRVEAVTGPEAENLARESEYALNGIAKGLKVMPSKLAERVEKLQEENKALGDQLKKWRQEIVKKVKEELTANQEVLRDTSLISQEVDLTAEEMRQLAEELVGSLKSGIILLASAKEGKANLVLRLSDDLVKKGLNASGIIRELAVLVDGSGGGKPNGAMAGGAAPEKIPLALIKIRDFIP
jgi:alanyl-tRNA synthetase